MLSISIKMGQINSSMSMKSKSLLINYSGYPTTPNAFMPDNGLAVLAGSLQNHGHETTILDYSTTDVMKLLPQEYGERLLKLRQEKASNTNDELGEISESINRIQQSDIEEKAMEIITIVFEEKIDFLAFKLWTGKGFENSIRLAEEIRKQNPSIPIYAGGPHVDYFRGRIYKVTDAFDVLAYGEGEETIAELADYTLGKRELESICNLVIKKGHEILETPEKRLENLDSSFPIYDVDTYPALKGNKKLKLFVSEFSRGCPFQCNFCGHSNKSGSRWRSKSAERICEEFKYIIKTHGAHVFRNGDSNTPGYLIKEVAERIIQEKLDVEYGLISHVNNLDTDHFGLLKESGCFSVFFGIESGNQNIVDHYMNKGLKLERAKRIIEKARGKGLFVITSYVYPSPGETEETKKDTFEFIKESRADVVGICTPMVSPGSTWGEHPEKYGIQLSKNYFDESMFFTPALFYPPSMWKPLNYKIDGKDFFEIAQESESMIKSLEKEGVLTQVMEDAAFMARHCGMSFRGFRDDVRKYLMVGDYENINDIVTKINEGVQQKGVSQTSLNQSASL